MVERKARKAYATHDTHKVEHKILLACPKPNTHTQTKGIITFFTPIKANTKKA